MQGVTRVAAHIGARNDCANPNTLTQTLTELRVAFQDKASLPESS